MSGFRHLRKLQLLLLLVIGTTANLSVSSEARAETSAANCQFCLYSCPSDLVAFCAENFCFSGEYLSCSYEPSCSGSGGPFYVNCNAI